MSKLTDLYFGLIFSEEFGSIVWIGLLLWLFAMPFAGRLQGEKSNSRKRVILLLGLLLTPCLLFLPLVLTVSVAIFSVLFGWIFDPRLLLLQLSFVAVFWFLWRWSSSDVKKLIAKSIQPWLFGMSIVGAAYLATILWLPRAHWSNIFAVETFLSRYELVLKAILPASLGANLGLFALFFALNIFRPSWKRWTGRFQRAISLTKSISAVLAVVTSFTFFGVRQAGAIKELTAEEKFERLKNENVARAELILAGRFGTEQEAETIKQFLGAIHDAVLLDIKVPISLQEPELISSGREPEKFNRARLSRFVRERAEELLEYTQKNRIARRLTAKIDIARLAPLFERPLTAREIVEAKEQFTKGLDVFAKKIAGATFHPLAEFLNSNELPGIIESIIKDLYRGEVTATAKEITNPIADVIFRPAATSRELSLAIVENLAKKEVFDQSSMPAKLINPTYSDRIEKHRARTTIEKSVKEIRVR
jgi:hypothetical protein